MISDERAQVVQREKKTEENVIVFVFKKVIQWDFACFAGEVFVFWGDEGEEEKAEKLLTEHKSKIKLEFMQKYKKR